jgi:hypothetical protein
MGSDGKSGGGGLRLEKGPAADGGLRVASSGDGALRAGPAGGQVDGGLRAAGAVEAAPGGSGSTASQPASVATFSFSVPDIGHWNAELGKGSAATLQLVGLWEERATLLANQVPWQVVRDRVSAFVARKDELARRGTNFQHLKNMPTHFKRWFLEIEALANLDARGCAAGLLKLARAEARAEVHAEALKAYETNDTSVKVIDYPEWVVLQRTAVQGLGLPQDEALEMCLDACRQVTRDTSWSPPPEPAEAARREANWDQQRRDEEARNRQALADAEVARLARALNDLNAAKAADEAARQRLREQVARAEAEAKKAKAEADAARAQAVQATSDAPRLAGTPPLAGSDPKPSGSGSSSAPVKPNETPGDAEAHEAERVRAERQVLERGWLRNGLLGGALGGFGLAMCVGASHGPSYTLLEARSAMVAEMPEARIRETCGHGRDLTSRRDALKVELKARLSEIPLEDARAKAEVAARCEAPVEAPAVLSQPSRATTSGPGKATPVKEGK